MVCACVGVLAFSCATAQEIRQNQVLQLFTCAQEQSFEDSHVGKFDDVPSHERVMECTRAHMCVHLFSCEALHVRVCA